MTYLSNLKRLRQELDKVYRQTDEIQKIVWSLDKELERIIEDAEADINENLADQALRFGEKIQGVI